jgi:L-ascorbate metabolism protein UlaG (beta-lactamase superfamily)
MHAVLVSWCALALVLSGPASAEQAFEKDVVGTPQGGLEITFIGHGTLMFVYKGVTIQVDPWSKLADYSKLPKADVVIVTHDHQDHFDAKAIKKTSKSSTVVIMPASCDGKGVKATIMKNGDATTVAGIPIKAVPAYNIVNKGPDGAPYHPKGVGNGYILTFGGTRVYVAGDTENTPEMKQLTKIDVAFLPMNLPYTMTPEMVADAALALKPKILYPYHFGETDTAKLVTLLKGNPAIEVRIRKMS